MSSCLHIKCFSTSDTVRCAMCRRYAKVNELMTAPEGHWIHEVRLSFGVMLS